MSASQSKSKQKTCPAVIYIALAVRSLFDWRALLSHLIGLRILMKC
jgi:hypothetical protein